MAGFERTDAAYAVGEREVVSTIEEAREQAREALELIHTWAQREQAWDTPRALDFARIGASIRALLDATEPPAPLSVEDFITGTTDGEVDTDEFFADRDERPAEDERERVLEVAGVERGGFVPLHTRYGIADALWAAGYRKGPRPITDEMVEAAARVMFDAPGGMTGDYTWAEMVGEDPSRADIWRADARAALEAAEGARR